MRQSNEGNLMTRSKVDRAPCERCGLRPIGYRRQAYCGADCARATQLDQKRLSDRDPCERCGLRPIGYRRKAYCGADCATAALRDHRRDWQWQKQRDRRVVREGLRATVIDEWEHRRGLGHRCRDIVDDVNWAGYRNVSGYPWTLPALRMAAWRARGARR